MSKKVLLVEDNIDLCDIYKLAFEDKDYEVALANNGMSAISLMETFKPDVVLLDIMMPYVSGYDFLKQVRSQDKDNAALIVVNSNLVQEEDVKKAKDLGADEYLKKSEYTPREVVNKVDDFLKAKLSN